MTTRRKFLWFGAAAPVAAVVPVFASNKLVEPLPSGMALMHEHGGVRADVQYILPGAPMSSHEMNRILNKLRRDMLDSVALAYPPRIG